jgi:hypothetical protein
MTSVDCLLRSSDISAPDSGKMSGTENLQKCQFISPFRTCRFASWEESSKSRKGTGTICEPENKASVWSIQGDISSFLRRQWRKLEE